jgi:hypothetical protein
LTSSISPDSALVNSGAFLFRPPKDSSLRSLRQTASRQSWVGARWPGPVNQPWHRPCPEQEVVIYSTPFGRHHGQSSTYMQLCNERDRAMGKQLSTRRGFIKKAAYGLCAFNTAGSVLAASRSTGVLRFWTTHGNITTDGRKNSWEKPFLVVIETRLFL